MPKTEDEWKKKLTPEQFEVLRKKGTERAFTGKLLYNKDSGVYSCMACGALLFSSKTKFESSTGWPSFYEPIKGAVREKMDFTFVFPATEIICNNCGSHLGHVFNDAPQTPTGMRYCLNSCALDFKKKEAKKKEKKKIG
jgi:peptide-methionine (R)-S-oxide reductase